MFSRAVGEISNNVIVNPRFGSDRMRVSPVSVSKFG